MEKWYLLAERFVTAIENFGLACKYAVEDDLAGKDSIENKPVKSPTEISPDTVMDNGISRTELLEKCMNAGIPIRNSGNSRDKKTDTLKREYAAYLKKTEEAYLKSGEDMEPKTQITRQEIKLALQEVMKKRDVNAVIDITRRIAGVVQIKNIPENKYAEILKEVNKL